MNKRVDSGEKPAMDAQWDPISKDEKEKRRIEKGLAFLSSFRGCFYGNQVGVEDFYFLETLAYSSDLLPEHRGMRPAPRPPCVIPKLGKTGLWESGGSKDKTNSLQELKQFPLYSSTSLAQYFNVGNNFLFLWNKSWACRNLEHLFSSAFLFLSVFFHVFWADT